MKRKHSTHHARDNTDYTDLTSNEAYIKRRAAVADTMMQASVELSLWAVYGRGCTKLEENKGAF